MHADTVGAALNPKTIFAAAPEYVAPVWKRGRRGYAFCRTQIQALICVSCPHKQSFLDFVFPNSYSAGFFLDHLNIQGQDVHTAAMRTVLELSDFVGDADCMKHYAGADVWKCGFAQVGSQKTKKRRAKQGTLGKRGLDLKTILCSPFHRHRLP
jgi:hypothetical protein